jgi:TonB family protein
MPPVAMTLRLRPRLRFGPALRRFRVPYGPLAVSATAHGVLIVLVVASAVWHAAPSRTYVVNLVPAVAAAGRPADLPPRAPEPAPSASVRDLPPGRDLPAKDLPPARDALALPEPGLPQRTAALPRPGDKELPTVASPPTPRPAPSSTAPPPAARVATPPPPPPPGQVGASSQGAGVVTLSVSDFPYAWYIRAVHRKIQERWEGRALQGRQPEVIFEIARDGQLRAVKVGRSSGNPAYDQLAIRAVGEANPFPPLPVEFPKPILTIGLQFVYDASAR